MDAKPNPDLPDIVLRLALDAGGHPYLFDAVSGRRVGFQRGVAFNVDSPYDAVLEVTLRFLADPRLVGPLDLARMRDRLAAANSPTEE